MRNCLQTRRRKVVPESAGRRKLGGVKQQRTPEIIRVLGLDPAAAGPTGYGVVESSGSKCRMVHYGALRVAPRRRRESPGAGLAEVHALLGKLIAEYRPHVMAVESVFTALNMGTALKLAEVRGVVLLAAEQHGIAVHSYSPREIKAAVAGSGNASKEQIQLMVRSLLDLEETPQPSDAADALAVALCHLQAERVRRRFALPAEEPPARLLLRQATALRARDPRVAGRP